MKSMIKGVIGALLLLLSVTLSTQAQQYAPAVNPVEPGKAPGMQVKLLSQAGSTKNYAIIFAKGDEVVSGMTEFAQKYQVKSAHYTGDGDALSAKAGWFDYQRKQFKIIAIDTAEVASFMGNIALYNGKPVAHTHFSAAVRDGSVHGGHLLELISGPTMEIFITVEPTPLYKKLDIESNAGLIDSSLER